MNSFPLLAFADQWILSHLGMLSTGLVITLLSVYGNKINASVRKRTLKQNFLLRYLIFILLCTLGYAFLTDWLVHQLKTLAGLIPSQWRSLSMILAFLGIALLAKREKQI